MNLIKVALAGFAVIFAVSCAYTPAIKGPGGELLERSITSLDRVRLGGVDQWILIRGEDITKPLLLFLHGGPGSAEMPLITRFNPALEKHFVVIMWDQRGAGKSYSSKIPKESMNIEQFISDCRELTSLLKERFGREKIYLLGHSWGSILGMYAISRYPEDYYAYVGIGQFVRGDSNEHASWRFCHDEAIRRGDKKAVKELESVGPPEAGIYKTDIVNGKPAFKGIQTERKWLTKYGAWWFGKTDYSMIVKVLLTTKEYTFGESLNYLRGSVFSMKNMWQELLEVKLDSEITSVKVPVYFCVGRHDYNTPGSVSYPYFEKLEAPQKEYVWFERSAHSPCFEEPEAFTNFMIAKVLPETYPK